MQSSITTYLSWLVGEVDEAVADEVLTLMTQQGARRAHPCRRSRPSSDTVEPNEVQLPYLLPIGKNPFAN
jgi:hypothetical protein